MIDRIYHAFLYFMGFPRSKEEILNPDGEHITDLLQRQKERFGAFWWVMAIGWVVVGNLFYIWLLLHVIGIAPFGKPRGKNG